MKRTKPQESKLTAITALRDISQVIVGAFELQELLDRVVATLTELSHADTCSIWLIDPDRRVRIRAAKGYHERLLPSFPEYMAAQAAGKVQDYTGGLAIPAEYDLGEGVTGRVAKTGEPLRTTGQKPHKEAHPQWAGKYDRVQWPNGGECTSFFGAPLRVENRIIGVLKIENKRQPDGKLAVAFTEEDEEVLTILANVIAVTIENQRLAEERRHRAEEHAWRLVSARLAHKIGNQNFAAKGLLGTLLECPLSEDAREIVSHVLQCSEAIDWVVTEAKRFSVPYAPKKVQCALSEFVESTVRNHAIADWGAVYMFQHEDAKGPLVNLDEAEIRHVLMELLENSQGFKKEDARITIRTARAAKIELRSFGLNKDFALIDYQDNGPGVARDRKEAIFEPFVSFRQGSGLGLSIVRQIIDAHHGKVVECGDEGKGARFLIFLPL